MEEKRFLDYLYVGIQLLLFVALLLCPPYWIWTAVTIINWLAIAIFCAGMVLAVLALYQLGSSLTPYPTPKEQGQLKTSGLYAYVRHPIYTSILLTFIGWALYQRSSLHLILVVGLWLLFYYKTRYEERLLIKKYGQAYRIYQRNVGRFLPKLRRMPS